MSGRPGGHAGRRPVPVSWGGDRIDAFVRGADRGLWVISREGGSWSAWESLIVDFQYRYGRIFADTQGINVSRVGVGVGVRF